MFQIASSLTVATFFLVNTASAQIVRGSGSTSRVSPNATPIMVATPFSHNEADSASAVEIGVAIRERMTNILGREFRVLDRENMNKFLQEYGYAHDAILGLLPAQVLAEKMAARAYLMPVIVRESSGTYMATARLIGSYRANNGAGFVAKVSQEPNQKLEDFGKAIANEFKKPVKAFKQAEVCMDLRATDPDKAKSAAEKALHEVDGFGLAEYCLGEMELAKDNKAEAAVARFRNALKSDPQAINALSQIGVIYQRRGDSAKVISVYQEMLGVDPLNQKLREEAYGLFQRYGRAGAAEEVADAGIQRDPNNTDWYDLKSNACLSQSKFDCAVTELERLFSIDSTRADTAFYRKIAEASKYAMQEGGDTAVFVSWATKAYEHYPEDADIISNAARAFALSGDADNAIIATKQLLEIDPENTQPLQTTAAMLGQSGHADKVLEFVPMVAEGDDQGLKEVFGSILVNAASSARSAGDTTAELTLGQAVLDVGAQNPQTLSYAGFFVGEPLFPHLTANRTALLESKSCEELTAYKELVERALPAFELAATASEPSIKTFAQKLVPFLTAERDETIPSLRTSFKCGDN